jgi:short-subunit dehydrogenase
MLARRRGRILNVASTAGFAPGPLMAVYYATKAYVLSLSEAIAHELKGNGVTVTALCPGPTRSGFQARAGVEETRLVHSPLLMEARVVARAGYRALMRGQAVVVPGVLNRLLLFSQRITPRAWVTAISAWTTDHR